MFLLYLLIGIIVVIFGENIEKQKGRDLFIGLLLSFYLTQIHWIVFF